MDGFSTQENILDRFLSGLCRSTHVSAQQQIAIAVAGDAAAGMHGKTGCIQGRRKWPTNSSTISGPGDTPPPGAIRPAGEFAQAQAPRKPARKP